jgi:hypothetical protein
MAKRRHDEPPPTSRTTLILLTAGGLAVAALVVWALTRTVQPSTNVAATQPPLASAPISPATDSPLTATQSATPPIQEPSAESTATVPRIAVEDLRDKMKAGSVIVIDVRDDAAFAAAHIPGAMHIPFARMEGEMALLPKGKPIVTYCT